MSREVRRVPLDYKHPTKKNPYWKEQAARRALRGAPAFTLHAPDESFIGLFEGYDDARSDWQHEHNSITDRKGSKWDFNLEYHLTGMRSNDGRDPDELTINPFSVWGDESEDGGPQYITVRDEDHLQELLIAEHLTEMPRPEAYMPEFEDWIEDRGWVLYETVTEGTPITPIFATAEELIQYLITVGTEWAGPMRESAARVLVKNGRTLGSVMVIGGQVLNSTDDADVIEGLVKKPEATTGD